MKGRQQRLPPLIQTGLKNCCCRSSPPSKLLYFSCPTCRQGRCAVQRGAGGGVSQSTTEREGWFRLHRPVNSFDQPDSPSPSGLVYFLPASFERFPSACEPSSGRSTASHPAPTLRSPPAAPSVAAGGQGGEVEKKKLLRINTVFFYFSCSFFFFFSVCATAPRTACLKEVLSRKERKKRKKIPTLINHALNN